MYFNYPEKYFNKLDIVDNFQNRNLNSINLDHTSSLNKYREDTLQNVIEEIDNEYADETTSIS